MSDVYTVQINELLTFDCLAGAGMTVARNDWVCFRSDRFDDVGRVVRIRPLTSDFDERQAPLLLRSASLVDQSRVNENRCRASALRDQARACVKALGLPMRVVAAHLTAGRDLVLVVFTAPGRVDFRDLLRDLRSAYGLRVELRQIGPRDQAAMVGGLGTCGRELCCSTFLTNFVNINVKMVKMQGLSLNPSSVMGACGRLKCCLEYEYEGYRDLLRGMPRIGTRCTCDGCDGRVVDANPMTQTVTLQLEDRRIVQVPVADLNSNR